MIDHLKMIYFCKKHSRCTYIVFHLGSQKDSSLIDLLKTHTIRYIRIFYYTILELLSPVVEWSHIFGNSIKLGINRNKQTDLIIANDVESKFV